MTSSFIIILTFGNLIVQSDEITYKVKIMKTLLNTDLKISNDDLTKEIYQKLINTERMFFSNRYVIRIGSTKWNMYCYCIFI